MKFSSAVLLSASASTAFGAALYSNGTSTATDIQTTVVTITSCADHKCTEIPQTTGVTTVTENDTIYTTYCPLTEAPASSAPVSSAPAGTSTKTNVEHTVVTVTSCDDNKCTEVPHTTGVTTVTENDTVYTTYCPLTEAPASSAPAETQPASTAPAESKPESAAPAETQPASSAPAETQPESAAPSTVAAESTAPAESSAPASSAPAATEAASSSAPSTVAAVSTAENAGNMNAVPVVAAGILGALALI